MNLVTIRPKEYEHGLRNPLKGFQDEITPFSNPYATLDPVRIPWSMLENSAEDGVERIIQVSDYLWGDHPQNNAKVVPRVYLHWNDYGDDLYYWAEDLKDGDYQSPKFENRLKSMIAKLGKAWDNDPRVAYVEMGLIGKWGEHHSPLLSTKLQNIMGDAFVKAFPNTPVMQRYPEDFSNYEEFGLHWDSWGDFGEYSYHVPYLEESSSWKNRWKTLPVGGETSFSGGTMIGKNPTDAVVNNHEYIIEKIESWHTNHLSWLSDYDLNNPAAVANASEIQKAFGYRFEIDSVTYPTSVKSGDRFDFSFTVNNTGNTPLYGDWPVELAFHDPQTREIAWQKTIPYTNTHRWLPDRSKNITRSIKLPNSLDSGKYVMSLAILDPASNDPAVKLAIENYWNGGRHPLGKIGIDRQITSPNVYNFDDPRKDNSLFYVAEPRLRVNKTAINGNISPNQTRNHTFSLSNGGNSPLAWRVVSDSSDSQPLSILLVDDDGNQPNVRSYYKKALNSLGYEYSTFDIANPYSDGPSFQQLSQHDLVIWFSGDLSSNNYSSVGPNPRDETKLKRYLNEGGKLIISSQEYASSHDQKVNEFIGDYLGVEEVGNDYVRTTRYLDGETVLSPLTDLKLDPVGDVYNDVLLSRSGQIIFSDRRLGYGYGIATSDTAYLAFPWESIYKADPLAGEQVMDSLIDYLHPPEVPWLSLNKTEGGIDVGGRQNITVSFDTRGYRSGDVLKADLEVWSNEERSPMDIPVTLNVN